MTRLVISLGVIAVGGLAIAAALGPAGAVDLTFLIPFVVAAAAWPVLSKSASVRRPGISVVAFALSFAVVLYLLQLLLVLLSIPDKYSTF